MPHAIDGIAQPDNRRRGHSRRLIALAALALAALLPAAAPRAADPPPAFTPAQRAEIVAIIRRALITDPTILRDAVASLQADEDRRQDAATAAKVAALGPALLSDPADPAAGARQADVTVVEFYDLHCPYCRQMRSVLEALLHDDPKVRIVYKDIPVLGPGSVLGARAVLAAQRQGGYAKLQAAIMQTGGPITSDSLHAAATGAGLDWNRLQRDMQDPAIAARLQANLAMARELGIDGTPAFVIGRHLIPGATDLASLEDMVTTAREE